MRKIKFIFFGIFLFLMPRVFAYDDGDFQLWHTDVEEKQINDKLKISLEEEFRWGDNASELYYHHYEPGLTYSLNNHLDVSIRYRQIYEKKQGKFKEENQPNLNVIVKWPFLWCNFDNRARLEYRHFDYQPDSWMYRNKLTAKLPFKFTRLQIQPYISDEIFLNFYNTAFTRNRFYAGFGLNLTKNIKAEIYYLLQSTTSSHRWTDANVLGTSLRLSF